MVSTACGACISIIVFTLTLIFGLIKLQHLLEHRNPQIVTRTVKVDEGARFSMADTNFMMAFAAARVANGLNEGLSDERYLKWIGTVVTREGVNTTRNRFYLHRCSDHEFSRFYQVENEFDARFIAKLQAEGHFYCVD